MNAQDCIAFIRGEIAEAEKAVRCRKEAQRVWADNDDATWRAVGCKLTKSQRMKASEREGRILVKCKARLQMFQEILAMPEGAQ